MVLLVVLFSAVFGCFRFLVDGFIVASESLPPTPILTILLSVRSFTVSTAAHPAAVPCLRTNSVAVPAPLSCCCFHAPGLGLQARVLGDLGAVSGGLGGVGPKDFDRRSSRPDMRRPWSVERIHCVLHMGLVRRSQSMSVQSR